MEGLPRVWRASWRSCGQYEREYEIGYYFSYESAVFDAIEYMNGDDDLEKYTELSKGEWIKYKGHGEEEFVEVFEISIKP